jgi:type I restriction enzyme S subunit
MLKQCEPGPFDAHHCQAEIKAQTVKNAQPNLALARIKSLMIPLPPRDEQIEIARGLDLTGRKADTARAKHYQLQDLFRTLLHELMTAAIRVDGLELEMTK